MGTAALAFLIYDVVVVLTRLLSRMNFKLYHLTYEYRQEFYFKVYHICCLAYSLMMFNLQFTVFDVEVALVAGS